MNTSTWLRGAAACLLAAGAATSQASPAYYSGQTNTPGGAVTGGALTAKTSMLALLSGDLGTETFDGFSDFAPATQYDCVPADPLNPDCGPGGSDLVPKPIQTLSGLTFAQPIHGTTTAVIETSYDSFKSVPSVQINSNSIAGGTGRFDTTNASADPTARHFLVSDDSFIIKFDNLIHAFGVYITDMGDFGGSVTAKLMRDGQVIATDTISDFTHVDPALYPANGALSFWGFIDSDALGGIDAIQFVQVQGDAVDAIGWDDMFIDSLPAATNRVPEPGVLALLGIALLGAGRLTRRR